MKDLYQQMDHVKQRWAQHPLYGYLSDSSIDPKQRLFVAPAIAYFAMCFRDLNLHAFRHEAHGSHFQELVNEQTIEDERHSGWFIADYHRLFEQNVRLTDAMRFLWGRESSGVRRAIIDFAAMTRFATPFERFVVFEAIERHGLQLFTAIATAAAELRKTTGENYVFFGEHHLTAEENHGKKEKVARSRAAIDVYEPSDVERARALELLELCYTAFNLYDDDLYRFATTHTVDSLIDIKKCAVL